MKKRAFTLIEILIVIAIIGLITSVILSYLDGARKKGRDAQRIADIVQINNAIQVYFDSCYVYPVNLNQLTGVGSCDSNKILNSIPVDPKTKTTYSYYSDNTPRYHVCTTNFELGYVGGNSKSKIGKISGTTDQCDGNLDTVFDKYGPN